MTEAMLRMLKIMELIAGLVRLWDAIAGRNAGIVYTCVDSSTRPLVQSNNSSG